MSFASRLPLVALLLASACGSVESFGGGAAESHETSADALTLDAEGQVARACAGATANHGACVSCVAHAAGELKKAGAISGRAAGALVSRFAKSYCGCIEGSMACASDRPGFETCAAGEWIYRDCGAGTVCRQNGDAVLCDWPQ